jgi:phosphatidylserine/phosphatidylglycerophosphate/cardiolipin synthase-like enzyme
VAEPLLAARLAAFEQLVACRNGARMTTAGLDADGDLRPPFERNDPEAVEALQLALSDLGFEIDVSGEYDRATAAVVKRFKEVQGLAVPPGLAAHDGVASRGTLTELDRLFDHELIELGAALVAGTQFDLGERVGVRDDSTEGVAVCGFENGVVVELGMALALPIPDPIASMWEADGGPASSIGVPVAPPFDWLDAPSQDFSQGRVVVPPPKGELEEPFVLPRDVAEVAGGSIDLGTPLRPVEPATKDAQIATFSNGSVLVPFEGMPVAMPDAALAEWQDRSNAGEVLGSPLGPGTLEDDGSLLFAFAFGTIVLADFGPAVSSGSVHGSYFLPPNPIAGLGPASVDNRLDYMIGGPRALGRMVMDIRRAAARPGDSFVFLADWNCDVRFSIPVPGGGTTTLAAEISAVAGAGVQVCALFWLGDFLVGLPPTVKAMARRVLGPAIRYWERQLVVNADAAAHIASAGPNTSAILDDRYLPAGSLHQKLLLVWDGEELVAYNGGIEWTEDRINPVSKGAPLFDVSSRVTGPAAHALLQTFADRWVTHPIGSGTPLRPATVGPSSGPIKAQVTHTYPPGMPFPVHVTTSADALANGIAQARVYFYMECQYYVGNPRLGAAIVSAMSTHTDLFGIVVIAASESVDDLPDVVRRRRMFLNPLKAAFPDRLLVFERMGPGGNPIGPGAYVHSKLLIVDDEAAFVGTVNASRRSWSHDSEATSTLVDVARGPGGVLPPDRGAIRDLRCRQWAEHLGVPSASLGDPASDIPRWFSSLPRLRPFDHSPPASFGVPDFLWDALIDPP